MNNNRKIGRIFCDICYVLYDSLTFILIRLPKLITNYTSPTMLHIILFKLFSF